MSDLNLEKEYEIEILTEDGEFLDSPIVTINSKEYEYSEDSARLARLRLIFEPSPLKKMFFYTEEYWREFRERYGHVFIPKEKGVAEK